MFWFEHTLRQYREIAAAILALLGWMVDEKYIEPHVSVWDKAKRKDNTFSRSEFIWNEQDNEYRCPARNARYAATGVH